MQVLCFQSKNSNKIMKIKLKNIFFSETNTFWHCILTVMMGFTFLFLQKMRVLTVFGDDFII